MPVVGGAELAAPGWWWTSTGTAIGHVLLVVGAGAVWPALLDERQVSDVANLAMVIALGFAIVLALAVAYRDLSPRAAATAGQAGE